MQLYLDVTDTFNQWRGTPTGIQRTLIGLALAARECPDVLLAAKDIEKPVWYSVPYESFLAIFQRSAPFKVPRKTPRKRPVTKPRRFLKTAEIRI